MRTLDALLRNEVSWHVEVGDVCEVLRRMPERCVHHVVTSPPYLGARAYEDGDNLIAPTVWPARKYAGYGMAEGIVRRFAATEWVPVRECEHKWGAPVASAGTEYREGESSSVFAGREDKARIGRAKRVDGGRYCVKCGCWEGRLGNEPSSDLFIWHLIVVFREVRRVLRDDGAMWVNIGDTMAGTGYGAGTGNFGLRDIAMTQKKPAGQPQTAYGVPQLLFLALKSDGWIVKKENIWHKPGPMPSSANGWRWERHKVKVESLPIIKGKTRAFAGEGSGERHQANLGQEITGRTPGAKWAPCPGCEKCAENGGFVLRRGQWTPTYAHEWLILAAKTNRYYADRTAVKPPAKTAPDGTSNPRSVFTFKRTQMEPNYDYQAADFIDHHGVPRIRSPKCPVHSVRRPGALPERCICAPSKDDHYAAFPVGLPAFSIKAFTPECGVCPECGAPWVRMVESRNPPNDGKVATKYKPGTAGYRIALKRQAARERGGELADTTETLGWRPSCACDAGEPVPAVVLDPFSGAATTGVAAIQLGRRYLGIEISRTYTENIAVPRLQQAQAKAVHGLTPKDTRAGQLPLFGGHENG